DSGYAIQAREFAAPDGDGHESQKSRAEQEKARWFGRRLDVAEKAIRFAVDPGGEVQSSAAGAGGTVSEFDGPQPAVDQRQPVGAVQRAEECAGWTKGVDLAIAEIAHQQIGAKIAETGARREGYSPRSIQDAAGR